MEKETGHTSDQPYVLVHKKEVISTLVMNRPRSMNALGLDMITELRKAFETVGADKDTRVVVLEGSGGNFSAGGDIAIVDKGLSAPEYLTFMKAVNALVKRIREISQPVICKVRGAAVGAGANLALAGDFAIASHTAQFQEAFVNLGLGMDAGGTYILPRLVGLVKARELAMLGKMFDGKSAYSMGLIYKSVRDEDLDQEVHSLANSLSAKSPQALASIKEGLETSLGMTLSQALEWEALHQSILLQTPEHKEVFKKFSEVRKKRS